jgi:predicted nucleic acid-binding Zn finger protein
VWYVRSQADGERTYEIKGNTCTCPDFKRYALMGETHLCKHVLAARMVEKAVTA